MNNELEIYHGSIYVEFSGLPSIKLVSVRLKNEAKWFQRIAEATRRRFFTLEKDWEIKLDNVNYTPELNGIVTVPKSVDNNEVVFDGASVPLPWLVSFFSIGILRPLGVMLTASILHDFAFKFGYLLVAKEENGPLKKVEIERHNADRLFRDIIGTVNQVAVVGWIAWFFVRLGWLFGVKYNGRRFTGKAPIWIIITSIIGLFLLGNYIFDNGEFQMHKVGNLAILLTALYLLFYFATVLILWLKSSRIDYTSNE